jgi:hypothetical protein
MRKLKPAHAMFVAVIALFVALGGGAVAGVTISKLNKKEKNQVKRIAKRKAKRLDRRIELTPGPKGDKGDPGEDATKLFAYVKDGGPGGSVEIVYGSGAVGVSYNELTGQYLVSFDRSLAGCVASVTPGLGNPVGSSPGVLTEAAPSVYLGAGEDNQVSVGFESLQTTSFMLSVFC